MVPSRGNIYGHLPYPRSMFTFPCGILDWNAVWNLDLVLAFKISQKPWLVTSGCASESCTEMCKRGLWVCAFACVHGRAWCLVPLCCRQQVKAVITTTGDAHWFADRRQHKGLQETQLHWIYFALLRARTEVSFRYDAAWIKRRKKNISVMPLFVRKNCSRRCTFSHLLNRTNSPKIQKERSAVGHNSHRITHVFFIKNFVKSQGSTVPV